MGILGCVVALAVAALPLYRGVAVLARIQGAADASALAGADAAAGIAAGSPCTGAAFVARANRTSLSACEVDGLVVTVTARGSFLGFSLMASATAGPPVG
jgi:hypothetical protein